MDQLSAANYSAVAPAAEWLQCELTHPAMVAGMAIRGDGHDDTQWFHICVKKALPS